MATTETNPSPPSLSEPIPRLDILQGRLPEPPSESKSKLPLATAATKSWFRKADAQSGLCRPHRCPANAAVSVERSVVSDTVWHSPPVLASSRPWTRPPPAAMQGTPACGKRSYFLAPQHMSDYIGPRMGQQGYERHQNRDVHQQRKIAGQRRLPGQLSHSRKPAKCFDRNGRTQRNAHRHPCDRQQLRCRHWDYMPEQNSQFTQTLCAGGGDVGQGIGLHQQGAPVSIHSGQHDQSNRQRTWNIPQYRQQRQHS